jgi:heme exporter protein B
MTGLWSTAKLVAAKDLRLELRSRVALMQVLPFALVVLLLFGFGLDGNAKVLTPATPALAPVGGRAHVCAGNR